jgi:uncharacterized damage-inducible protein DinB
MLEQELRIATFNLQILDMLTRDLTDEHIKTKANGVGHTPAWILGHLAIAQDFALKMLGAPTRCPAEWMGWFGPGSKEDATPSVTKADLLQAIRSGHEAVADAVKRADAGRIDSPHGIAFLADTPFETFGHAISNLMTGHEAMHTGQLSAWRRQMGFPPLF